MSEVEEVAAAEVEDKAAKAAAKEAAKAAKAAEAAEKKAAKAAEREAAKAAKAAEKKAEVPVFVGPNAASEGTVYDRLRKVVSGAEGLPMDELITHTITSGFVADNSKAFTDKPASFLRGYFTTGIRKGFFATTAGAVYTSEKRQQATRKVAKEVPESASVVLLVLQQLATVAADGESNVGVGVEPQEIVKASEKTKSTVNKALKKLEEGGYIELDQVGEPDPKDVAFLTQKGSDYTVEAA